MSIKSKYAQGSADAKIVAEVWEQLRALFGYVLSTWSAKGRRSTTLDQITERHLNSVASRVNRIRKEAAVATGQSKYITVSQLDALKAIYQGSDEFNYTEIDAATLVDKLLKEAKINTSLSLEQRLAIHDLVFEAYVSAPEAQDFVTLEDLGDSEISAFDPPKPAVKVKPSQNGMAEPALA